MSDKCPQNFVQVFGQMSVSDKCPCRTNVRVGQMSDCFNMLIVGDWLFTVIQWYPFHPGTILIKVFINQNLRQKLMIIPGV